jgi:hypothetical protein
VSETRTIFDPFELKTVEISNRLVDRLRGKYASGPHLPNGNPEFGWRQFQAPPIQHEAAAEIERLTAIVSDLVKAAEPVNLGSACAPTWLDSMSAPVEILEGLTIGDLRALSEAVARAGKDTP